MLIRLEVWAHQHHVIKTGGLGSSPVKWTVIYMCGNDFDSVSTIFLIIDYGIVFDSVVIF